MFEMSRVFLVLAGMLITAEAINITAADTHPDLLSTCSGDSCSSSRTFGLGKRRMAMFMLPVMFKLGVIVTLLVGLTVLAFKGLTIGVILLIFAFGGLFSKLKLEHSQKPSHAGPVHLHVHDVEHSHKSYPSYSYGQWDRQGESNNYEFVGRAWPYTQPLSPS